jgi:hypothetical protein
MPHRLQGGRDDGAKDKVTQLARPKEPPATETVFAQRGFACDSIHPPLAPRPRLRLRSPVRAETPLGTAAREATSRRDTRGTGRPPSRATTASPAAPPNAGRPGGRSGPAVSAAAAPRPSCGGVHAGARGGPRLGGGAAKGDPPPALCERSGREIQATRISDTEPRADLDRAGELQARQARERGHSEQAVERGPAALRFVVPATARQPAAPGRVREGPRRHAQCGRAPSPPGGAWSQGGERRLGPPPRPRAARGMGRRGRPAPARRPHQSAEAQSRGCSRRRVSSASGASAASAAGSHASCGRGGGEGAGARRRAPLRAGAPRSEGHPLSARSKHGRLWSRLGPRPGARLAVSD